MFSSILAFFVTVVVGGLPFADAGGPVEAPIVAQQQQQQQSEPRREPIDINTATAEKLQEVPGIGETLAKRIVEFRNEHGRFEKVDDLLNVRGIGVASLDKLRPHLVVKPSGG